MPREYIWIMTFAIIGGLVGYGVVGIIYPPLPVVDVHIYNNAPANYQDGFRQKAILSNELPREKFVRNYKYVVTSQDGARLDGKAYLRKFGSDGDAIVKKRSEKGEESLVLFTDYQPDAFSWDQRERQRSKWLKMPGRSLPGS
ncbi:MAG: hypothetical protein A3J76_03715 [Candidatus Moranbacteria bacterium RBG_13_45_13]|nr:MAG: hypothetical protein A3J76_03715 [Candidatus Moranbacteria bacterium RBG_13_45_13]